LTSKNKIQDHPKKRVNKDRLFAIIRILVSVSLFAFLIVRNLSSVKNIISIISSFDPFYLIIATACFILGIFFQMLRWNALLEAHNIKIAKIFLMRSYYIGFFYSNIFPTNLGGDLYRGYDIYRNKNVPVGMTISAGLMERLVGVTSGALFVIVSFFFIYEFLGIGTILSIMILPVLIIFGVLALIYPRTFKIDRLFIRFKRLKKFENKFYEIHESFLSYRNKFKYVALSFLFAVISHLIFFMSYYYANLYIKLNLDFFSFFFLNPIIVLSSNIPVSIGGIGIRENIAVLLLTKFGAPSEQAFIFALVVLFMILLNAAIGAIIYVLRNVFNRTKKIKIKKGYKT
jgi:uncharacterized protein (TIRG00374 family)